MRLCIVILFALMPARLFACGLALVLAVDVSGSVDPREYRVQMDGLAAALRDGSVVDAMIRERAQVTLIQWSGSGRQRQTVEWQQITSAQDAARFAGRVAEDKRVWRNFSTAVGEAVGLSLDVLQQVTACTRKVIDVSGDGVSNEGVLPQVYRTALQQQGVTVNALAIETGREDVTAWFYENLIHGDGAFVITADGFEDYPPQILRKLQREVTRQVSSAAP